MQGGARWQPPDIPNTDEVLVRPEPADDEAEQDQQAPKVTLNRPETLPLSVEPATSAAVATVSRDDSKVEDSLEAQDGREKEQHRHRHRSDTCIYMLSNIYMRSNILHDLLEPLQELLPPHRPPPPPRPPHPTRG